MNSRERVIGALNRQTTDRIPVDLACSGPNSAIDKLLSHYGVDDREQLLQAMEIDIRHVSPQYIGPDGQAPIGSDSGMNTVFGGTEYMKTDFDGSGGIAGTYADDLGSRPFKNFTTVKEIEQFSWPTTEWYDFSIISDACQQYRDYGVILGGWSPIISRIFELFGMEKGLTYFYDRPDLIHATIKMVTDFYYEFYDRALREADGGVLFVGFGDDFASQRDLLLSPAMWRTFSKKPLERLFSLGKKHNVFVFLHACGAVRKVIPDLVEIGLDVLWPIQPNAAGMIPLELKAEFGDDLAFWGAIDVQRVLPYGTVEDVRRHAREQIEILGAGGGYILSSGHNLLKGFPLENILALYDEALKTRS